MYLMYIIAITRTHTILDCSVGRYGDKCSNLCHCADNQPCDVATGQCKTASCYPGWNGTSCNKRKCV